MHLVKSLARSLALAAALFAVGCTQQESESSEASEDPVVSAKSYKVATCGGGFELTALVDPVRQRPTGLRAGSGDGTSLSLDIPPSLVPDAGPPTYRVSSPGNPNKEIRFSFDPPIGSYRFSANAVPGVVVSVVLRRSANEVDVLYQSRPGQASNSRIYKGCQFSNLGVLNFT